MGIPVTQPTYIFGDNQSVLVNSATPHSQLKKKANSVAYHHVREGTALDEWRLAYVNTTNNASDMMSKPLHAVEKRNRAIVAQVRRVTFFVQEHYSSLQ